MYDIMESMNHGRHLHKRLKHSLLSLLVGVLTLGPISTAFADDIYQQEDVSWCWTGIGRFLQA